MEALRVSIGLEAYAQRDPLVQYKNRAFELFQQLLSNVRLGVISRMYTYRPRFKTTPVYHSGRTLVRLTEQSGDEEATPDQGEATHNLIRINRRDNLEGNRRTTNRFVLKNASVTTDKTGYSRFWQFGQKWVLLCPTRIRSIKVPHRPQGNPVLL